jgi:hypothetical protein
MSTDSCLPGPIEDLDHRQYRVAICRTLTLFDALPKLSDVRATGEQ